MGGDNKKASVPKWDDCDAVLTVRLRATLPPTSIQAFRSEFRANSGWSRSSCPTHAHPDHQTQSRRAGLGHNFVIGKLPDGIRASSQRLAVSQCSGPARRSDRNPATRLGRPQIHRRGDGSDARLVYAVYARQVATANSRS